MEGYLQNFRDTTTRVPGIGDFVSPGMPNQVTTSSSTAGSSSLNLAFWKRL